MSYAIKVGKPLVLTVNQYGKRDSQCLLIDSQVDVINEETNEHVDRALLRLQRQQVDLKRYNEVQNIPLGVQVDREHVEIIGSLPITLKRNHQVAKGLIGLLILAAIIGGGLILHQHHVNQANQAAQSSLQNQLADQKSNNQHLTNKVEQDAETMAQLKQEVKDLRNAVQNYVQNQNQQAFQQQLDQIKQQLANVNADNSVLQDLVNRLTEAINQLSQVSPQQAQQILQKYHLE